jgi:hypothetical protein
MLLWLSVCAAAESQTFTNPGASTGPGALKLAAMMLSAPVIMLGLFVGGVIRAKRSLEGAAGKRHS